MRVGPWVEALVADGEGPRVSGLLLLWGLVAGEHWIGRGSDLQRRLVHLQAEDWHEGALTLGKGPTGQTQQSRRPAWSSGSYSGSVGSQDSTQASQGQAELRASP